MCLSNFSIDVILIVHRPFFSLSKLKVVIAIRFINTSQLLIYAFLVFPTWILNFWILNQMLKAQSAFSTAIIRQAMEMDKIKRTNLRKRPRPWFPACGRSPKEKHSNSDSDEEAASEVCLYNMRLFEAFMTAKIAQSSASYRPIYPLLLRQRYCAQTWNKFRSFSQVWLPAQGQQSWSGLAKL